MGEVTLINLRLGVNNGLWDAALYGHNLLNDVERQERSLSSILDVPGRPRFTVNRPRTFGVQVSRKF